MPFSEWTPALWFGVPLVTVLLALFVWRHRRMGRGQLIALATLRALAMLALVWLASRPTWSGQLSTDPPRDTIALLLDRSESMALADHGSQSRYHAAVDLLRDDLISSIEKQRYQIKAFVFADSVDEVDGDELLDVKPDGIETNLPQAVLQSLTEHSETPLAVIALTDGISTNNDQRHAAATALLENGVPFIGIGFGSETGPKVLTLQGIAAPSRVAPHIEFRVEAALQALGSGRFPSFGLALLRNGKLLETRTIEAFDKSRMWQESFRVRETEPGKYRYTLRLLPPADELVRCSMTEANALVQVADEDQWRVLFIQGGLTWDFKFIQLAIKQDPSMQITGLSRTASGSRFFQNVDDDTQLVNGFPADLEQLSAYRVVVLANLKPSDLGQPQQEMLVQFCEQTGGGVLLLGGAETFNLAWRGSALERLLPVRFAAAPYRGAASPFRITPTPDALQSPVFQLNEQGDQRNVWNQLPSFSESAQVESLKPGATIWLERAGASYGSHNALMAVQRYGAGRTAALCVPNLWRWRLAKNSTVEHFDRFWQQLFRYLGGGDAQSVAIHLADQLLMPEVEVRAVLAQHPAIDGRQNAASYRFVVENQQGQKVAEQQVELTPGQTSEVVFVGEHAGLYTLRVLDSEGIEQGNRVVELKNLEREFAVTARDMENLRQWAQLSDGYAIAAEDCEDVDDLVAKVRQRARERYQQRPVSKPAGMNGWMLAGLMVLLGGEWLLRRRWSLR